MPQAKFLDPERRFQWLDGQAAFAFGKHKGFALAQVAAVDAKYMVSMQLPEMQHRVVKIVNVQVIRARPHAAPFEIVLQTDADVT